MLAVPIDISLLLFPMLMAEPTAELPAATDPPPQFQIVQTGPGLTLHKEMFMLPVTYSNEYNGRQSEAVFQLSAKQRLFDTRFYFGYTQISFWQAYDIEGSAPFRDTNYNPEIFYRMQSLPRWGGQVGADAGFEHESNGQRVPLSRSWNLLYLAPSYQRGRVLLYLKLRYRLPEETKQFPEAAEGDDNPDITDYLGYSDAHLYLRVARRHAMHVAVRGLVGSGKGNVSLTYSCTLPRATDSFLVLRLFHGYGESLMDYRKSLSRVGVGLMFAR